MPTNYTAVKVASGGITRSAYNTIQLQLTATGTFGAAPVLNDTITVTFPLSDATPDTTNNDAVTQLIKALYCS